MSDDKALLLVLDLRKKEEDKALELWTDAKNAVINFQKQIEQLVQFEGIYQRELEAKSRQALDMQAFLSYQQFIEKLSKIKLRQEAGLVQLQQQEQRAKDNYLEKQNLDRLKYSLHYSMNPNHMVSFHKLVLPNVFHFLINQYNLL